MRGRPALSRCADRSGDEMIDWVFPVGLLRPLGLWRPATPVGRESWAVATGALRELAARASV